MKKFTAEDAKSAEENQKKIRVYISCLVTLLYDLRVLCGKKSLGRKGSLAALGTSQS